MTKEELKEKKLMVTEQDKGSKKQKKKNITLKRNTLICEP